MVETAWRGFDPACDFCRIGRGLLAAQIVTETAREVAFFPDSPATLGHTLVIPRAHTPNLWVAPAATLPSLLEMAAVVGRAIMAALQPAGMNLIHSAGAAATQTVFHLHLHLVPRWSDDHIGDIWPPKQLWNGELKEDTLEAVRGALSSGATETPYDDGYSDC
jgi:histidine triad (HIT) family protein